MRLPLCKVYRAFPELDRFEDAQCKSFVASAQRAERGMNNLLNLSMIPWCIAGSVAIGYLGLRLADPMLHKLDGSSAVTAACIMVLLVVTAVLTPAVSWLMIRDAWLRRAIARRIDHCDCPECQYSLLGLPTAGGSVKCPECGTCHQLATLGLSPSDILAPPGAGGAT